jgi:hypothetical protein
MKTIKWMTGFLVYMLYAAVFFAAPSYAAETQTVEVGRIYHIEGELLRYVPEGNDWVAVVKDAPFGAEDTLFSGSRGMAEMIVPNGSWIRIGNNTQIQFITLEPDLSDIDVASGTARFYNKGTDTVIRATSPFGYVLADPGTVFDFYVGENSAEVVAIKGTVNFIHSAGEARYGVSAGSPSILADQYSVSSGDGTVDLAWNRWNEKREIAWAAKTKTGHSAEYLPPGLRYDADCLDEYGRWEFVIYDGAQRWFWRPTSVYAGWSPFTLGVWTEWCGDQTWIPREPFGYVTHHYGNWVFIGDFWYWAPPVVSVRIGFPVLDIGFFWNPGRVAWIHRGIYVGWIPLAPHETYYSHRDWGDHHGAVVNESINQININVRNYTYINRAVIVNSRNFHGGEDYRKVRVANVHPTIINKYNGAPVVNNTVINNYETNKQRYKYTNTTVQEKPHSAVLNRVRHNETAIRQGRKENVESLQQQVKSTKEGRISRDARIEAPKAADYLVPAEDVNRPKSEITLQQREIKNRRESAQDTSPENDLTSEKQISQKGQRASQPEQTTTSKAGQVEKPMTQPRVVAPAKPNEPEKPAVQTNRSAWPAKTTQQERSAQQPEQTTTLKAGQVEKPVTLPRVVTPAKPNEPEKPAVQTNRGTAPEKSAGAGSFSAPATQTEKVTDKSRKVERSGSAVQKRKAQKTSDENGGQSENGPTGNPER